MELIKVLVMAVVGADTSSRQRLSVVAVEEQQRLWNSAKGNKKEFESKTEVMDNKISTKPSVKIVPVNLIRWRRMVCQKDATIVTAPCIFTRTVPISRRGYI